MSYVVNEALRRTVLESGQPLRFARTFAMPSAETFSIKPVAELLGRYLPAGCVVVDPFARNSRWATISNDLDPETEAANHLCAEKFCEKLLGGHADVVLFDPPYSPRQITESYKRVGLKVGMQETQNGRLYKTVRDLLDKILKPQGIGISFGWNSSGFGRTRGYDLLEILMVNHGGAHNDTIVTLEQKR